MVLLYVAAALSSPMKPPQRVYTVRILAAPVPETQAKTQVTPQKEKPKTPKPKVQHKPSKRRKPKKRPKPKPTRPRKAVSGGTASISVEGKNFSDDFYLNLIMTKIANNWLNPLRGGRRISVVIYFRILRSGDVVDVKVERSSGNSLFDQAALRAVLASSPLPPLPQSYTGDFLGVHFEFEHAGR